MADEGLPVQLVTRVLRVSELERSGRGSWRVRHWRDDGTHGSLPGFPTMRAAEAKAREIDTERCRGHATVAFTLDTYTADVPELHHHAAETVSDLFLADDPQEPGEPPIDLP